jgi:hypothetical protein
MTPQPPSPLTGLSRRRMLGLTLGLGAVLLSGCSPGAGEARRSVRGTTRCQSFDDAQVATLEALIAAVVPTTAGFPSAADAEVLDRFDEETYFVSAEVRDDIRTAVDALEYLPLLYGHFARFSHLARDARQHVLAAATQSRFAVPRAVAGSLRMMVHLFYYGHRTTWPATGFDGPFARVEPILSEQRLHFAALRKGAPR